MIGAMEETGSDIGTLAAEITLAEERTNSNVVKAVFSPAGNTRTGRALYFTRATAPAGEGHSIITSAYTPIAGRRWNDLSGCRLRPWNSARSWNSFGHCRLA